MASKFTRLFIFLSATITTGFAAISVSNTDAWDISSGITITATSGIRGGFSANDMFGGRNSALEPTQTVFADGKPAGFVHFIEWKTPTMIRLGGFRLFASGDEAIYNYEREIGTFVLKAKRNLSDAFTTIYSTTPPHPYKFVDPSTSLVLDSAFTPMDAQYFRAEFVQWNAGRGFDGPRVIELDAVVSPSNEGSREDLFDVAKGARVIAASPTFPGFAPDAIFGNDAASQEIGSTVFGDGQPNGAVHFVEWKTATPVLLSSFNLYASGDPAVYFYEREFEQFTLKVKSKQSDEYKTVYTFTPTHPYTFASPNSSLLISAAVGSIEAEYFRAEFVQRNVGRGYDGPRVIELDGFGTFLPAVGERPVITKQPENQIAPIGGNATFSISVSGTQPFKYQWLLNNLTIHGATSAVYQISNVQIGSLGDYRVIIENSFGLTVSSAAILALPSDSQPPIILILSPASGTIRDSRITLEGIATDQSGITSLTLERDGGFESLIPISDGHFTISGIELKRGTNTFRLVAVDSYGNQASATAVFVLEATRSVYIPPLPSVQEGGRFRFPVLLKSEGDISALSLKLNYDPAFFSDPEVQWSSVLEPWGQANSSPTGEVKFAFALPGTSLRQGTQEIAEVQLRVRSVRQSLSASLGLALTGVYSITGDPLTVGSEAVSGSVTITKRKYVGDNNANDRLDVGDASMIMRFITGIEVMRAWDVADNDLNKNSQLDAGDAIRVLRAAVNIDPQPNGSSNAIELNSVSSGAPRIILRSDRAEVEVGEELQIALVLEDVKGPLFGTSFLVHYPSDALRIENGDSHRPGSIVPSGTMVLWNLTPAQSDYENQDGDLFAAFSGAMPWGSNTGEVAVLKFRVLESGIDKTNRVTVSNFEYSDGIGLERIGNSEVDVRILASKPPQVEQVTFKPDLNQFSIKVKGLPGKTYRIEYSEDLHTWKEVRTYVAESSDSEFAETNVSANRARFYRVVRF